MTATDRTRERLEAHYAVERELADRLRFSSRQERRALYAEAYDELFRRVPDHPQLVRKAAGSSEAVGWLLGTLEPYLGPDRVVLEIGSGDGATTRALAARCDRAIAVEVSTEVAGGLSLPPNAELLLTDGIEIPVSPGSIDVAFSNQVLEHIHPDDVHDHLEAIRRALRPGGTFVCLTPTRLTGPHDISGLFDQVPRGFHLREYSPLDVERALRAAGFSDVRFYAYPRGHLCRVPRSVVWACEAIADRLSRRARGRIVRFRLARVLLDAHAVGIA